jgi:hypothetical protein
VTAYGITQPAGGTWKAEIVATHLGLGAGLGSVAPWSRSRTAAIFGDPLKLTQPCMVVPEMIIGPKQIVGDPIPGHRSRPQPNGRGCRTMRAMGRPSGATTARTAAIAGGQGSATAEGLEPASGTHTSVSVSGVAVGDGVTGSGVPSAEAAGVAVGACTEGLGDGAHPATVRITATAAARAARRAWPAARSSGSTSGGRSTASRGSQRSRTAVGSSTGP